jgi:hypothetical protein
MLKPLEWQNRPALIEHLFPVQKLWLFRISRGSHNI